MTVFLWDASHFDGTLTKAILAKAKAEGIVGFTHKLGEGATHGDDDSNAAGALTAARDAGIPALGGYWFCHGDSDAVAQADLCIAVADAKVPWWREFPGWFWQPDCENESGHPKPTMTWIKAFSDRLVAKTGRTVIVYASHGQYGNSLAGLGHPLWNANYPSARQGPFRDLYPGDQFAGWSSYSGQTPVICQYTSSATIGGRTTCDANAFRGSVDDLLNLIGADMPLTPADYKGIAAEVVKELLAADVDPTSSTYTLGGAIITTLRRTGLLNSLTPAAIATALVPLVVAELPTTGGSTPAQIAAAVHGEIAKLGITIAP